ncbi:MAG: DUF1992 domain-containing protein [Anaerolineales bacterium]|jgi:hypothetical protein|nr:DUF1992 domain-containing protein [Anaerolineales bacterium]
MPIDRAIEAIIREAMARGEFDNLPGKGKTIDLTDYFNTPEDLRLAYSIMKNAGVLPEEVEILKEIEALNSELEACTDESQRKQLKKKIEDRKMRVSLLLEGHRARRTKSSE